MKFLIVSLALIGCVYGQLGGNYRPYQRQFTTSRPYQPPVQPQYQAQPQYQPQPQYRPSEPVIAIRSQTQDSSPDGAYRFSYETENGISVDESGTPDGPQTPEGQSERVQGRYAYTAPDGTPITVEYYADETGFHATGAHIPTPPPIPEAIQRAIATLPASNEGQYQEEPQYNRPYNPNAGTPYRRF